MRVNATEFNRTYFYLFKLICIRSGSPLLRHISGPCSKALNWDSFSKHQPNTILTPYIYNKNIHKAHWQKFAFNKTNKNDLFQIWHGHSPSIYPSMRFALTSQVFRFIVPVTSVFLCCPGKKENAEPLKDSDDGLKGATGPLRQQKRRVARKVRKADTATGNPLHGQWHWMIVTETWNNVDHKTVFSVHGFPMRQMFLFCLLSRAFKWCNLQYLQIGVSIIYCSLGKFLVASPSLP